jgi:hypothetical protein
LNNLIQDCLLAYADIPLLFPEQNLISVKFMESPESPAKALVGSLKLQFVCQDCGKMYRGNRQLMRHRQRHTAPDKYRCNFEGCQKTFYRIDTMRVHGNVHEKREKRTKAAEDIKGGLLPIISLHWNIESHESILCDLWENYRELKVDMKGIVLDVRYINPCLLRVAMKLISSEK